MQSSSHRLSLSVKTPKTANEGKTFSISYRVRNIGSTSFPGGIIVVELSWESLPERVYQSIPIASPLAPDEETAPKDNSQEPLMTGFTWFYVAGASASDGRPVEVFKNGGTRLWPHGNVVINGNNLQFR